MLFSYKKFFQVISLLFIIWINAASSAPTLLEFDKNSQELSFEFLADNVKNQKEAGKDFVFSPISLLNILNILTIVTEDSCGEEVVWDRLKISPDKKKAYEEYLLKKGDREYVSSPTAILYRDALTPKKKEFLRKLPSVYCYDCLSVNKFDEAASKANEEICKISGGKISQAINPKLYENDKKPAYIVVNATYYKSHWGFECSSCYDKLEFHNSNGNLFAKVPAFKTGEYAAKKIKYIEKDGHHIFFLPFLDRKNYMCIILPCKGVKPEDILTNKEFYKEVIEKKGEACFLKNIDLLDRNTKSKLVELILNKEQNGGSLQRLRNDGNYAEEEVVLSLVLPEFFIENKIDLTSYVPLNSGSLDARDATVFEVGCSVEQKASIKVNEDGVEAIAITDVCMHDGVGPTFIKVPVDRPFAYMIVDSQNNDVVFGGTVYTPTSEKK